MEIQRETPMPSRPCHYCLCLQNGAVFADFNLDAEGCLYLVRISFDGYGCYHPDRWAGITKIDAETSKKLIKNLKKKNADMSEVSAILSRYFYENKAIIWTEALEQHSLI